MRAIELFAGAGGLGLGVTRAGFTPLAVVERDRWCCETIRQNRKLAKGPFSSWPLPIEKDVRKVAFGQFEGKIDLVTGGPPCQPFSLGGKHKAFRDDRDMWPEAVRAVREAKPAAFMFENVKGLTRQAFATYLEYIVLQLQFPEIVRKPLETWLGHLQRLERQHTSGKLRGLSYKVTYRVLNAADFGVPQKRERVVFVGFRSDLNIAWNFPSATHSRAALLRDQRDGHYWERHRVARKDRRITLKADVEQDGVLDNTRPWMTTRDALADLPDPEAADAAAIQGHKFQPGARAYPGHTGSPFDEPAKTLKAGVHGVPGGENMLLRPDGSVRYFTVRESARLQTFPDSMTLQGSWSEAMRQLGNAVPVGLAHHIARDIKAHLERRTLVA